MDFRLGIGSLDCRLCGASYQMPIHHLHEPVDVFSEWLDDCEAAALGKPTGQAAAALEAQNQHRPEYDISDDENDEIDETPALSSKTKSSKGNAAQQATPNYADLGLGDSDDDSD